MAQIFKAKVNSEFIVELDGEVMTDSSGHFDQKTGKRVGDKPLKTWMQIGRALGMKKEDDLIASEKNLALAERFKKGEPFELDEGDMEIVKKAIVAHEWPSILVGQLSREIRAWSSTDALEATAKKVDK